MPRPKDLPPNLDSVGKRVAWWRKHRKMTRAKLAKACEIAVTTLADLEGERQDGSRKLHLIAAELGLNPYYAETGEGEPEAEYAQERPHGPQWPFPEVPAAEIERLDLNMIERRYAESRLLEALSEIKAERRKSKKTG